MAISNDELALRVQRLQASYAQKLPARLVAIIGEVTPLRDAWSATGAVSAAREAHNLAGTAATFGFAAVGVAARELEHLLLHLHAAGEPGPGDYRDELGRRLVALLATAQAAGVDVPVHGEARWPT
ncbi:MAG: Hpt domain-containing protein [Myxococcales bacterium]|nr:Hpt domain-containing protein [Myxococcales bacterium]MCB9531284.1 Hpt domain-containing protein [Myxococcales bacterium]